MNKTLKKQMLNLEDYKDSEVILTVRPIGFRKLSSVTRLVSETDTESTVSYVEEKKQDIGGFTNDAFEDDKDSVDFAKLPLENEGKILKETHFGSSWMIINEQLKEQFHKTDSQEDKKPAEKKTNSAALKLDNPEGGSLSGKMDFEDDGYPRDEDIYEQVPELTNDKPQQPLAGPMQIVLDENDANLTLEFNNSKESSMIWK